MEADVPTWADFASAWELFRAPIVCASVAGAALGFLGVFVVLRRMVFVSAGVTQSAGLGVALAFYAEIHLGFHIEPLYAAAFLALLATVLVSVDTRGLPVPRETVLGLVYALAGGGAVMVADRISQEAHDIEAILFGSAVLVRPFDLWTVLSAAALVSVVQLATLRGQVFASFDPDAARVQGVPVRLLNRLLFLCVGLMVGVSARALGSLPVFAFSVAPAAAALILGLRLPWALAVAAVLGAFAGAAGYVFAYFFEFPVGGSQTAIASMTVLAALIVAALAAWIRARGASPRSS